ncbi:winged helix-turn-helix domain-containing protein [Pleurocapsales cyanobacterium LEGE 10410]|nr:winged helix-turn-helix domain-containing protein [Pleurocapsales cyanobacterium LEGE 10410]
MLDDIQLAYLWQRLQTPPADGGFWNSRKVADWMSELLECRVSQQRGWDYLRGYELRLKQPRPAHTQSDPNTVRSSPPAPKFGGVRFIKVPQNWGI